MTTLDLRPSGLPIISTRGAMRTVRFVFESDQTGNVFAAYIATRINSVAHVANLNVSVSGVTVTMTISAAATVLAAGAEHYWVLTRNGEPLLYDILEVSSIPGVPTTSTVSVELITATGEATVMVSGVGASGANGVGDTLRVYNNSGTQVCPGGDFTKVTLFDTQAMPGTGWSFADFGDLSGGSTFTWDNVNKRINVLRSCMVQPFINLDTNPIDVRIVDPVTGKVDPNAAFLVYVMRPGAHPVMCDAVVMAATPALTATYAAGGGNALLPLFPVQAGDYLEFFLGVFGTASATITYADLNVRNVSNVSP